MLCLWLRPIWMASLTRWTWVWVNFRSWWWTERSGVLRFMGWQRVRHDWATELNWEKFTSSESVVFGSPGFFLSVFYTHFFFPSCFTLTPVPWQVLRIHKKSYSCFKGNSLQGKWYCSICMCVCVCVCLYSFKQPVNKLIFNLGIEIKFWNRIWIK